MGLSDDMAHGGGGACPTPLGYQEVSGFEKAYLHLDYQLDYLDYHISQGKPDIISIPVTTQASAGISDGSLEHHVASEWLEGTQGLVCWRVYISFTVCTQDTGR